MANYLSRRRRRRSSASAQAKKNKRNHHPPSRVQVASVQSKRRDATIADDSYSLLSPGCSSIVSHAGFSNLVRVLLILTYTKDILKNIRHSGWHADLFFSALSRNDSSFGNWSLVASFGVMFLNILFALALEKFARTLAFSEVKPIMEKVVTFGHTMNCILSIVFPSLFVLFSDTHILMNFATMLSSVTLCMKLVSYAMVNRKLREEMLERATSAWGATLVQHPVNPSISPLIPMYPSASSSAVTKPALTSGSRRNRRRRSSSESSTMSTFSATSGPIVEGRALVHPKNTVGYPNNVNLSHLMYFVVIPSLVYQPVFPRTNGIRWMWLAARITELAFCSVLLLTIVQQYVAPVAETAIVPFQSMDLALGIESLLELAIPQIKVWLLIFYTFFHLYMNILAEVMCYANRTFYRDWWNARNLEQFWRKWNIPVHTFIKHHVYIPLAVERHYNNQRVMLFCFFLSAVFHELIFSVSFRSFNVWAFLGMMAQIPLVALTRGSHIFGTPYLGNTIFWLSIIIGQPLGTIMYYYDYCMKNAIPIGVESSFPVSR